MGLKKPLAVCAVSSNIVTTKNIEIPSIDPAEIKSIIDLQAGRHTPYSREEILIGYITIGIFQRNYTKVLLVIVNRDQILKQLRVMTSAGVKVEKVVFAPEAAAIFYSQGLKVKDDEKPIGVIDITQNTTDFIVEWNKTVITSRNIPVGMSHLLQEGKPAQEKLATELQKSMEVYQTEDIGQLPEQYVLTSDDAKLQDVQPLLQTQIKATVKTMPYRNFIPMAEAVTKKLTAEYSDDSFLNVIAAVSMKDKVQVDLTPDEIRSQRSIEEKGRQLILVGVGGLVILVLVCMIFFSKIYFRGVYLDKLKHNYETKKKVVDALDRLANKTRIIKDYTGDRLITLDTLKTLYGLLPDEIYLQSINFDENGTIEIAGISESMSRVFNLVTALEDSDLFKNVKTKSTSTKQERGKEVAAFEITLRLESAPDEEETDKDKESAKAAGKEPAKGEKKAEKDAGKEVKKEKK